MNILEFLLEEHTFTFSYSYLSLVAQLVGFGGTYMLVTLYQQKSRRALLFRKLTADVLWTVHYLLLSVGTPTAFAGAIPNGVGILRESVFLNEKHKWARSPLWPIVFILIGWAIAIPKLQESLWGLLPMCATTIVTVAMRLSDPRMTKLLSFPACLAFLIYDIVVGSWAGLFNEALSLASIVVYLVRARRPAPAAPEEHTPDHTPAA